MRKRNAEIDIWRVAFAFMIVCLHSTGLNPPDMGNFPFVGAAIVVDGFFIISGAFAVMKSVQSQNEFIITFRKFKPIMHYVIPAVLLHYTANAIISNYSLRDYAVSMAYSVFEMLPLTQAGIYKTFLILPLWYLSALFICYPLLLFMLRRHRNFMTNVFAPLSAILIYGFICHKYGDIDVFGDWVGICNISVFRAWASLCLGVLCSKLAEKIIKTNFTPCGKQILAAAQMLILFAVVVYSYKFSNRQIDFICVFGLVIAFAIIISEQSSVSGFFKKFNSEYLAEYSLALYVSHWTIRMLIPYFMPTQTYYERFWPYVLCALLYGFVFLLLIRGIKKIKISERFRKLFIAE